MLPTATSCTSRTKIFTWASARCRPAPYVERQPWQVVSRTAQAHRRHSTWTQACAAQAHPDMRAAHIRRTAQAHRRHSTWTQACAAQAHTAMRAAHTRRTGACTTLTCAHQRRGGRVRGGEQGRQQALHRHKGRWGTHGSRAGTGYGVDTMSASSVWANRGRATTNCTGTPNASERRLLACACTCAATCQHPPGGRPARAPRAPAAAAPPRPHRAPGAGLDGTCTRPPAGARRQQRARRQDKARGPTQAPWVESRRPHAQPTTTSPPRPPPHRIYFPCMTGSGAKIKFLRY